MRIRGGGEKEVFNNSIIRVKRCYIPYGSLIKNLAL